MDGDTGIYSKKCVISFIINIPIKGSMVSFAFETESKRNDGGETLLKSREIFVLATGFKDVC